SKTGYRSKSMLVVPMRNHEDEIIGVLQLLNALNPITNESIPFTNADQGLIISLASQAAVAITNTRLIHDLEQLLESFIQVIASAIDEKSPYTGGHIERVAKLTMMIAENINNIDYGVYAPLFLNHDELKELRIASWMHDIGKITTPEYVVDKSSKLETIYDRINTVKTRFEVLKRDAKIELLEHRLKIASGESLENLATVEENYHAKIQAVEDDLVFIETANIGGEFMAAEKQDRVKTIGQQKIEMSNETRDLLDEDEILNLCIPRGTLTNEEREIINHHVVMTITMLEKLPYPKKLRRVPEYAGGHHEKLDGTGYPSGLKEDQLSPQSRMMALADIFEALTARDRPYKKGKTLSEAMKIMGFMAKDKHIDPELFKIFVQEKLYLKYAQESMDPSQIDDVDPKIAQ
ncbi:MAG: HD domain-containing phosphohydrolase, partial [Candidatus Marinimicrobia bacterium]|nr:HD domain-containing phosphohydrolase [Candidatus Neomarinimicrobiota bacterium]